MSEVEMERMERSQDGDRELMRDAITEESRDAGANAGDPFARSPLTHATARTATAESLLAPTPSLPRRSLPKGDRFDLLIDVLAAIARGETNVRLPVSDAHDTWDAVAVAINFTVDELAYRNVAVANAYETIQRTESELREQQSVLRTLLDSVADVLLVYNRNGDYVEVNRTAVHQLGYTRGELLQMNLRDIEVEDRPPTLAANDELAEARTLDGTHRRKDGTTYPVEMRVVRLPFRDQSHYLVLARDVTERQRAEAFRQAVLDHTMQTQENERRRIARELHDGPCQVLTSLLLRMDAMAAGLHDDDQRKNVTDLRTLVADAVSELRTISHRLRPPALDELGVVAALERLVEEAGTKDFKASFIAVGAHDEANWPSEVATAIYRMAQESLQNVARHANASRVSVSLTAGTERIRLIIEDNGCGFSPETTGQSRGLGLVGMRERARSVGGSIEIESWPGDGTTIFIDAPLTETK